MIGEACRSKVRDDLRWRINTVVFWLVFVLVLKKSSSFPRSYDTLFGEEKNKTKSFKKNVTKNYLVNFSSSREAILMLKMFSCPAMCHVERTIPVKLLENWVQPIPQWSTHISKCVVCKMRKSPKFNCALKLNTRNAQWNSNTEVFSIQIKIYLYIYLYQLHWVLLSHSLIESNMLEWLAIAIAVCWPCGAPNALIPMWKCNGGCRPIHNPIQYCVWRARVSRTHSFVSNVN